MRQDREAGRAIPEPMDRLEAIGRQAVGSYALRLTDALHRLLLSVQLPCQVCI